MPAMSDSITISITAGHVGLVLLGSGDSESSFYLEIPVDTINANSLDAASYLRFVAWCVLGVEGMLSLEPGGEELGPEVVIREEDIYYYIREEGLFAVNSGIWQYTYPALSQMN
jgi:hypothetical protein